MHCISCFGQATQSENVRHQKQVVKSGICNLMTSTYALHGAARQEADMPHTYCWGAARDAAVGRTRTHVKASVCLQQQSHTWTETNTVTPHKSKYLSFRDTIWVERYVFSKCILCSEAEWTPDPVWTWWRREKKNLSLLGIESRSSIPQSDIYEAMMAITTV
jgi:hypothetical protein